METIKFKRRIVSFNEIAGAYETHQSLDLGHISIDDDGQLHLFGDGSNSDNGVYEKMRKTLEEHGTGTLSDLYSVETPLDIARSSKARVYTIICDEKPMITMVLWTYDCAEARAAIDRALVRIRTLLGAAERQKLIQDWIINNPAAVQINHPEYVQHVDSCENSENLLRYVNLGTLALTATMLREMQKRSLALLF